MKPKQYVRITDDELNHLDKRTAQILCAVAEAAIGADFADIIGGGQGKQAGFKAFVLDVDNSLNYFREENRDDLMTGLRILETRITRYLFLVKFGGKDYSRMSLTQRQELLRRLAAHDGETQRRAYSGFVNLASSFFYGHENSWKEIQYEGVSVDNQDVLKDHRWRPNDPRPTKPCVTIQIQGCR